MDLPSSKITWKFQVYPGRLSPWKLRVWGAVCVLASAIRGTSVVGNRVVFCSHLSSFPSPLNTGATKPSLYTLFIAPSGSAELLSWPQLRKDRGAFGLASSSGLGEVAGHGLALLPGQANAPQSSPRPNRPLFNSFLPSIHHCRPLRIAQDNLSKGCWSGVERNPCHHVFESLWTFATTIFNLSLSYRKIPAPKGLRNNPQVHSSKHLAISFWGADSRSVWGYARLLRGWRLHAASSTPDWSETSRPLGTDRTSPPHQDAT